MAGGFLRTNWLWILLGTVICLGAAGYGWYRWQKSKEPDMVAVLRANNRGVGLMEQFQYRKAARCFEEVTQMAPNWLPGKINLGIALMNDNDKDPKIGAEMRRRARQLFTEILDRDPDNPNANFCLGIILHFEGKPAERRAARMHFEKVTRVDPTDAAAWFWLGKHILNDDLDRACTCFRRALKIDPQLSPALYNLWSALQRKGVKGALKVYEEFKLLQRPGEESETRGNKLGINYGQMGRYGDVIGRLSQPETRVRAAPLPLFRPNDKLKITLARGTRWATRADLGKDALGQLRSRVRDRFGAVMVVLDYNRDNKPDLFLVGAVVRGGKVRDLLLRNDGNHRFTDVTEEAGLGEARPSLGCCVADYDNDGYPDLLITGAGEQHLFRNTGKGRFEDVTSKTELDKLRTICLGAAFVDLDQDGDLDLIVAQYAALDQAGAALQPQQAPPGPGLAVFLNIGEALPGPSNRSPPLTTRFRRVQATGDRDVRETAPLLGGPVAAVNITVSDLDQDHDLDLFILADGQPATMVLNDRVLRFHRLALPDKLVAKASWNGALVFDVNRDGRSDLLLVGPGQAPLLLVNEPGEHPKGPERWFKKGVLKSPPLLQAQAVDLDLDGWTDIVGLSEKKRPVLLHNQGGRLVAAPEALGSDRDWPKDVVALAVADFTARKLPDVMVWSESQGLQLRENQGNGNRGLHLLLSGQRRQESTANRILRCNADGIGVKVVAQAGDVWTGLENTTMSAGLGQSRQPLLLGLGRYTEADVVRLYWPDNTLQAELNLPTQEIVLVAQKDRRTGSCPILFTWNGERYTFVTDFLGAGSLGESQAGGGYRTPRPEESVKIEAHQLKPRNGEYVLKIAEPMDEATYLDRLELVVLDHPAGVAVYPDERFTDARTPPSQQLLAFTRERRIFPRKAVDHRGRDVTRTLRRWDRDTVNHFAQRSWMGLAEEHWVELDFGNQLEHFRRGDRLFLCLAGWTDYPYPESIWAAEQAGVAVLPPVLERLREDGNGKEWEPVVTADGKPIDAGFPAGLPRLMTLEVTCLVGKHSRAPLCGRHCVLRLRTNMEVYWDQAFVAPLLATVTPASQKAYNGKQPAHATCLQVSRADLAARGLMQEFSPDGRQPTLYDYDRVERVPVSRLSGRMTRYGDVTKLLRETDDCFVIFGPGDVLTVRFDARSLPRLPDGWVRSFVLRTWGYCKDSAPFTATGDTVEPLPFRKMSTYPYGPREHYPRSDKHNAYRREYNTRLVGPRPLRRAE
jgi:tetratricopeptide (TPR) repeat protein